ncbi:MAG TPA: type II secretion system F family protein [Methanoregulaceae archaeon]|nr:type II secretion system F family protein [Methanoregulaceae archaeon]
MTLYSAVHQHLQRNPDRHLRLNGEILSARLPMTTERFIGLCIILSALSGFLIATLGFWAAGIVVISPPQTLSGIYNPYNIVLPGPFTITLPLVIIQLVWGAVFFIVGTLLVYFLALKYPGMRKNTRATKINLTLHNAVAYMYAMRRGGAQLMAIFRSLSENAPIYGEVALEFRQVVRDADFFGLDVVTSLRRLMETTPSQKMKQFLEDMISVIETGGDLTLFLSGRVRLYQEEARFEQRQFLNFLALIAESYVTLFVAGPLFLIIILVVMGMMGGAAINQMVLVVYALIPIGSLIFIVLIDMISIKTEGIERYTRVRELKEYSDVRVRKQPGEEKFFEKLLHYDRVRNFKEFIRHPMRGFILNFKRTLFITVPIAVIYLISVYVTISDLPFGEEFINLIDDHLVIAALIILIPYGIFYELWRRNILGIESLIPDFLDRMAGINQVGLTIAQAVAIMVNTRLGLLSYEIKRIKRDMDWGANFTDALMRFEERVSTPMIARTVTLISKASQMSGSIGEVLTIAASDARMSETLKKERLSEMFIYTAIVYLAFVVFIFVVAIIDTQFLPVLTHINTSGIPTTAGAFSGLKGISIETFSRLMYHACLLQAFFSGLIAGQMGESSINAGLKHAAIMMTIALIVFNFVI